MGVFKITILVLFINFFGVAFSQDSSSTNLVIPSVFTPNFDGVNDGFNVQGDSIVSVDKKIFNRWGELLFESKQLLEVWNGRTTAGEEAPEGTYFYIFSIETLVDGSLTPQVFKGSLSLLR